MRAYNLAHLRDDVLLRDLATLVAQDCSTTALVLAHIAEVDARRLYLPAAYPSMHAYCVGVLHFSDDAAYRRIQAARAARAFPALFEAVADGRLHLTAVCLLAPHLTLENVDALVAGATHRRKSDLEAWLARMAVGAWDLSAGSWDAAPGPSGFSAERLSDLMAAPLAPAQVEKPCPPGDPLAPYGSRPGAWSGFPAISGMAAPLAPAQVAKPLRPIALHLKIGEQTQAKLRHAQELLSHAVPSGDLVEVLDRALDALIGQLEKRKFGAAAKPQPVSRQRDNQKDEVGDLPKAGRPPRGCRPGKPRPRSLPAHVRRAVWERDRGQCTFTSEGGRRCGSRTRLEFDHVVPVARGGQATVEGLRLRCRGHNQFEAERAFGADFVRSKREQARHQRLRAEVRGKRSAQTSQAGLGCGGLDAADGASTAPSVAHATARATAPAAAQTAATAARPDLARVQIVWTALRRLGFRMAEARLGSQYAASLPHDTLEECLRAVLQFLGRGPVVGLRPNGMLAAVSG